METDRLIFSRDVVIHETTGPFLSSTTMSPKDQPMKASDLGVHLPLGSPDGRASNHSDSEDEESPRHDIVNVFSSRRFHFACDGFFLHF